MLPDGRLIYVRTARATFGLIVRQGVVVGAAPIARWSVGLREDVVARRLRARGAVFVALDPPDSPGA